MNAPDEETVRIVAAIAGLLAGVAYADRQYRDSEHEQICRELARIQGMSGAVLETICAMLKENVAELAAASVQYLTRELKELTDYETRLEVLRAMMSLAAADGLVSLVETNFMRRAAELMGLSSYDYNEVQARYRDRLSVLNE